MHACVPQFHMSCKREISNIFEVLGQARGVGRWGKEELTWSEGIDIGKSGQIGGTLQSLVQRLFWVLNRGGCLIQQGDLQDGESAQPLATTYTMCKYDLSRRTISTWSSLAASKFPKRTAPALRSALGSCSKS